MNKTFLITGLMASVAFASNAVAGGSCGDNCTWDLEDGVLTISGTGPMMNIKYFNEIPWYNQRDSITSVQVSNGITSIAPTSFRLATNLTSVTIPDSVTSIGSSAFYGVTSLKSITIPKGVTSIERSAFRDATSLTSVTIPEGVTSIGTYAFEGASSLTSITIPNSVNSIAEGTFSGCTSLTSINIPEGVTSIGHNAFYGASSLTSITIPNSVTSIGSGAFSGATGLTSITIPEGVTSIGYNAFRNATSLTSITIPDTAALQVSSSGKGPFYNLDLSNVTIHCAGVLEQCKANMAAAGYADGTYNMVQAPYSKKQADGSRAHYDANGKLTGFTGKRIYTVEEARAAVEAAGTDTVNFRIRYK